MEPEKNLSDSHVCDDLPNQGQSQVVTPKRVGASKTHRLVNRSEGRGGEALNYSSGLAIYLFVYLFI